MARGTATSSFGVSRRENHDSAAFYARFQAPELSTDTEVTRFDPEERLIIGDSRDMSAVPSNSIALVVTSPPYFAGKEYEEALGEGHIPASYVEFLDLLRNVFAECKRTLEPGGRIAVNVANLGRKPYRSLSADVIRILQDDLGLLLRGEVLWVKAKGASGSTAWGTFKSPVNPVLRDLTERIIIASKGRFARAGSPKDRREGSPQLPYESTVNSDEFLEATSDVWDMPPESATRIGHPAPFPVELPQRLILLYTFKGDVVLDPFIGSGTTAVAAIRTEREYVGYDTDGNYVELARSRTREEHQARELRERATAITPIPGGLANGGDDYEDFQARATREGKAAQGIAENVLKQCGFRITARNKRLRGLGLTINFVAQDQLGQEWFFDVSGAFTTTRGGLLRTDTVWKSLGRANVLALNGYGPVVFLTSHLPKKRSGGDMALRAAGPPGFFDAIEMLSNTDQVRLTKYGAGLEPPVPIEGFWSAHEIAGCERYLSVPADGA